MLIKVKVTANAKKSEILGWKGDCLKVRVAAPREKGKANAALLGILNDAFAIPLSQIQLKQGFTSPLKLIEVPDGVNIGAPGNFFKGVSF